MEKDKIVKLPFFGMPLLWRYIKKYRVLFVRMMILGMAVSVIDAIFPLFNQYAVNHFIAYKTMDTIAIFVILYILCAVSQALFNYFNIVDCATMEMSLNRDLRNNAFSHLQEVSLSYFNSNNVGYIHARVMSDSGKIGEMIAWQFMNLIWFGSYIIFAIVVMMLINIKLALVVMIIVPVTAVLMGIFQQKLLIMNRQVREQNSIITANINEGITGVKAIKTLAIEEKMSREFEADTSKMYEKSVKTTHYSTMFISLVTLMTSVVMALILWKGGEITTAGIIEIGTLSVFMTYALSMLDPVKEVINSISRMIAIGVNIERYQKLIDTEGEVYDSPEVVEKYGDSFNPKRENWEELHGDIEFKDITFKYPDGEEIVLENFNLKVPQGQSIAIVGETGAGKSTLVNLVCRFFEPTKGQVLIDGKDAKARSLKWLHSNIGYVLQTPHLFSGTVRENLKYGKEDATDGEILDALKIVGADKVIEKFNNGLDTELGEGGDFLSTGEKQLLSIARALLADPKILILDEATSSIDTVTEHIIQEAIATLTKGRTSFIIAHRLSTIVGADQILVVSDGKIVERGTHKELMNMRGDYYNLYTRQYEELALQQL